MPRHRVVFSAAQLEEGRRGGPMPLTFGGGSLKFLFLSGPQIPSLSAAGEGAALLLAIV